MAKRLMFSVTLKDCRVDTFRSGGPGGQNQNKRDSGVRITHPPSGAVGESREHKSQLQNKKAAFVKMANSVKFTNWIRRVSAKEEVSLQEAVDAAMHPKNLKVEGVGKNDEWEELHGGPNVGATVTDL